MSKEAAYRDQQRQVRDRLTRIQALLRCPADTCPPTTSWPNLAHVRDLPGEIEEVLAAGTETRARPES